MAHEARVILIIGSRFVPGTTGTGRGSKDFIGRLLGFASTSHGEGQAEITCLPEGNGFGLVLRRAATDQGRYSRR